MVTKKRDPVHPSIPEADIYRLTFDAFSAPMLREIDNSENSIFESFTLAQSSFGSSPWVFADAITEQLIQKLDNTGEALGHILVIGQGMQTGRNNVFGKLSKDKVQTWGLGENSYYTRARNSDIERYRIRDSEEILLYVEDVPKFEFLPQGVQDYLKSHQAELRKRAAYQRGDCDWWKYTWPLHKEYMGKAKIYCPYMATENRFAIDEERKYLGLTDTTVLFDNDQPESLQYLVGLLNSSLLNFRFRYIGKLKSNGIREYFWNGISKIPIYRVDFSNPTDVARHDEMVALVERMLALHRQLAEAKTPQAKRLLKQQIDVTDRAIDQLVYKLYDLTDEEIAIVEAHA